MRNKYPDYRDASKTICFQL
ncbi:Protein of unknown function, partial [Gryllus bimaculatus]